MTTRLGSSSSLPLIAVVLVGGLGIVGYRMMSGSCSSCTVPETNAAATTVANEETSACCAELNKAETILASEGETSSCSSSCSEDGAAILAGAESSCCASEELAEGDACCEDKDACCKDKSACEESAETATVSETEKD